MLSTIRVCGLIWGIISIIFAVLYLILMIAVIAFGAVLGSTDIVLFALVSGVATFVLCLISGILAIICSSRINRRERYNSCFIYCLVGSILALIAGVSAIFGVFFFSILLFIAGIIGIVFAILLRNEQQNFIS